MFQALIPAATLLVATAAPVQTGVDATQNTVPPAVVPPLVIPTVPETAETPTPTPTAAPEPAPTATRTPRPTPTPSASPNLAPAPVETPTVVPPPLPEPAPTAVPTQAPPQPSPAETPEDPLYWPWLLGAGALGAAIVFWRRRRPGEPIEVEPETLTLDEAPGLPEPEPVAPSPAPAFLSPRPVAQPASATPEIAYRPVRLGLNLISATVDGEITITNPGPTAVAAVRVRAAVLGAAAGHEESVAAIHRSAGRPVAPAFALEPGASRTVRAVAAVARDAIAPLAAGGRPMFVPLVAITLEWRDNIGEHRLTQAFAVGIERVDSSKLAPVWLDQDSRMYDAVAARPHGAVLR